MRGGKTVSQAGKKGIKWLLEQDGVHDRMQQQPRGQHYERGEVPPLVESGLGKGAFNDPPSSGDEWRHDRQDPPRQERHGVARGSKQADPRQHVEDNGHGENDGERK